MTIIGCADSLPSRTPSSCWHSKPRLRTSGCRQRRCRDLAVEASIRARWCIDIKYGVKLDAVSLVSEWVQNIGSQAGLSDNAQILSGAVGVPESRIELEVEFATLAELEQFWAKIPPQEHKAWSQRAQHLIIDGSPKWEIYRTVPINSSSSSPAAASIPQASKAAPTIKGRPAPVKRDPFLEAATAGGVLLNSDSHTFQANPSAADAEQEILQDVLAEPEEGAAHDGRKMVLDWKGDPMYIYPGDKLPF